MLIVILVIFGTLLKFANRASFIRGKKIYLMIGTYMTILLISMGLYLFILEKEELKAEQITTEYIPNLESMAYGGKSLETIAPYLVEEHNFNYENDQLNIQVVDVDYTYTPILIDQKEENDHTIEVNVYQIPTIIEGTDVTELMESLTVDLTSQVLLINTPPIDIRLNVRKNDFPFRQFTGEKIFEDEDFPFGPNQLVHVQIPKDIELHVNEDVNVHYINVSH